MLNIFVHSHPGPRSNRLEDAGHFHFRDLEMASSRSSKVKFVSRFWKADIDFPVVFHSNHMHIMSHRFEAGAYVCSTEHMVGQLSPPLLENGWTELDDVWFLA